MPTRREDRTILVACLLLAGLTICTGLMRGPVGEVAARAVREDMVGNQPSLNSAEVRIRPAEEAQVLRVVSITASNFRFNPQEIMLTKGQAVTLRFISIDRTYSFAVRGLGIDTSIYPGTTMEITVRPQVAGRFKAMGKDGGAGPTYMNIVVVQ